MLFVFPTRDKFILCANRDLRTTAKYPGNFQLYFQQPMSAPHIKRSVLLIIFEELWTTRKMINN